MQLKRSPRRQLSTRQPLDPMAPRPDWPQRRAFPRLWCTPQLPIHGLSREPACASMPAAHAIPPSIRSNRLISAWSWPWRRPHRPRSRMDALAAAGDRASPPVFPARAAQGSFCKNLQPRLVYARGLDVTDNSVPLCGMATLHVRHLRFCSQCRLPPSVRVLGG